jgi:hypothetical protein
MKKIQNYIFPYAFFMGVLLIGYALLELSVGHPLFFLTRPCGECLFPQVQYGKIIAGIGAIIASFFPYVDQKHDKSGFIGALFTVIIGIVILFIGVIFALWGWSHYTCYYLSSEYLYSGLFL